VTLRAALPAEFDDFAGCVFEEVTIVGDDDAGEAGGTKGLFEPLDSFEVEMIGGLVEEEDVGLGDHGLGNGEALAPAAGEGGSVGIHADGGVRAVVGESGAAERFAETLLALVGGHGGGFEGGFEDAADGCSLGVLGDLLDVANAGAAADGDFTGVGLDLAGEDGEQGGLPGAVGPDEADTVALVYCKGDVFEEGCGAKALRHALCVQNRWHPYQFTGFVGSGDYDRTGYPHPTHVAMRQRHGWGTRTAHPLGVGYPPPPLF